MYGLLIIIMAVFVVSCNKRGQETIKIPSRQVLNSPFEFLIPKETYNRVYQNKDIYSSVVTIVCRGDILQLRDTDGENAIRFIWYNVSYGGKEGWILVRDPIKVSSKEQAYYLSRRLILDK